MSKVVIKDCEDYQVDRLISAINGGMAELGGWDQYIRPGMKALLKVNLIGPKTSESAAVTHKEFVRALARILKSRGCIVWVGDSAGGAIAGVAPTEKAFQVSGLAQVAQEEGIILKNFEREGVVAVSPPGNDQVKYYLAKPLFEADLVINLPKLKTHISCIYTGAVKNLFGCVPGLKKAGYHKEAPNPHDFGGILYDIHRCLKVGLHIIDGVTAMEGEGPSSGKVYPAHKILFGRDPLALDAVAVKMLGLDLDNLPFFDVAREQGLGVSNLEQIEVVGDYRTIPALKNFKMPRVFGQYKNPKGKMFEFIINFLKTRPRINRKRCKNCNLCVESCPAQAIDREAKRIDYGQCIECLCCHELCVYKAVEIKNDNWLAGILMKPALKKNR
ncbi:MAG: DUF362 domain-containing protein [Firmicutes bacterium]|nr:DUF362 domain-containing protein [Bacillota bacterium]